MINWILYLFLIFNKSHCPHLAEVHGVEISLGILDTLNNRWECSYCVFTIGVQSTIELKHIIGAIIGFSKPVSNGIVN